MCSKVIVRPITRKDVESFNNGELYAKSLRGLAVEKDGETIAIAGIIHSEPPTVFSEMHDEMRKHPVMIMKTAKRLLKIMKSYNRYLIALANPNEKTAPSFLKHLGFEYIGEDCNGEYYGWGN